MDDRERKAYVVYVQLNQGAGALMDTPNLTTAIYEFTKYDGVTYDKIEDVRDGRTVGVWLIQTAGERVVKVEV